jgi:DNA-binding NarL/FixJ family response regulator
MKEMKRLRVLIVDDSEAFLQTVSYILACNPAVDVVGCAKTGEAALEMAESANPDLILMDLKMPGMGGIEATRRLKATPNSPHVAIVTAHDDPANWTAATEAGADDFITKTELAVVLGRLIFDVSKERLNDDGAPGYT